MQLSVLSIPRGVRRRLRRVVQRSGDAEYRRRAHAVLLLHQWGGYVSGVAEFLLAARSSVNRWRGLYETYGEDGLRPQRRGRTDYKANDKLLRELTGLVEGTPQAHGYLRSRWSSELLARELRRRLGVQVHATTIRRWLFRLEFGWRRARPTLHKRDPRKTARMRAINAALNNPRPGVEVFYVDEADIDLNPRIGPMWSRRGQQHAIPTPGVNRKSYLAGALHARSGRVVWCEGTHKNTDLFLCLLESLRATYRRARRIVVILDNFGIHKSLLARAWTAHNPKFELLFQPVYHPWVNEIERLWKQLHDTVTRNHRHDNMASLMHAVRVFLTRVQPFPGADYVDAKL